MGTAPYAISVHSFVNSVGADAGFASIIGLAILVLLYFAQARETATLRERLDDAQGRVEQLEQRLAAVGRAQAQQAQAAAGAPGPGAPVAVPAGTPSVRRVAPLTGVGGAAATAASARPVASAVASAPVARDTLPGPLLGAPAGVAAPALTSATKLIPTPGAMPALERATASVGAPAQPAPVPAGVAAGAAGGAGGAGGAGAGSDDTMLSTPAPMTAAGGANGHARPTPPVAPPPTFGGPAGPRTATTVPPAAPPRVQMRPGEQAQGVPQRTIPPARPPASEGRALARRIIPALIGLIAVVVIVVALLIATGGSSTSTAVRHNAQTASAGHHAVRRAINPATVTVAVLNGTAVDKLAKDVGSRLAAAGYRVPSGSVTNAVSQTHTATIVGYTPGRSADARAVAKSLGLPAARVAPVSSEDLGVVCPATQTASCQADVVVTVGTDLATTSTTTTSP